MKDTTAQYKLYLLMCSRAYILSHIMYFYSFMF